MWFTLNKSVFSWASNKHIPLKEQKQACWNRATCQLQVTHKVPSMIRGTVWNLSWLGSLPKLEWLHVGFFTTCNRSHHLTCKWSDCYPYTWSSQQTMAMYGQCMLNETLPFKIISIPSKGKLNIFLKPLKQMTRALKRTSLHTPPKFNSSPLKHDGWKTILSFWDPSYFQGLIKLKTRNP